MLKWWWSWAKSAVQVCFFFVAHSLRRLFSTSINLQIGFGVDAAAPTAATASRRLRSLSSISARGERDRIVVVDWIELDQNAKCTKPVLFMWVGKSWPTWGFSIKRCLLNWASTADCGGYNCIQTLSSHLWWHRSVAALEAFVNQTGILLGPNSPQCQELGHDQRSRSCWERIEYKVASFGLNHGLQTGPESSGLERSRRFKWWFVRRGCWSNEPSSSFSAFAPDQKSVLRFQNKISLTFTIEKSWQWISRQLWQA